MKIWITAAIVISSQLFQPSAQTAEAQARDLDQYMLILIDKSDSMRAIRKNTKKTRWHDALDRARRDIVSFNAGPDNNNDGDADRAHFAVWVFSGSSYQEITNGFVRGSEARRVIDNFDRNNDPAGRTPLAKSVCDGLDHLVINTPGDIKVISLHSDGDENNSGSHPCAGPSTISVIPPFDLGSWNNKVYNKVLLYRGQITFDLYLYEPEDMIRALGHNEREGVEGTDERPKALMPPPPTDAALKTFQALAQATGGNLHVIADDNPMPVTGDITGDYCVNDADVKAVLRDNGKTVPPANPDADLNRDGMIDEYDYLVVLDNYGEGGGC